MLNWMYFLIFLSFNICIMFYVITKISFSVSGPSNILSQRFDKFRNILPLAFGEISLILFQDYFMSAKSYSREKNSNSDLQYVTKHSLTTEMKGHSYRSTVQECNLKKPMIRDIYLLVLISSDQILILSVACSSSKGISTRSLLAVWVFPNKQ